MEAQVPASPSTSPSPSRFKRVCVFCGSSTGRKKSYQLAAIELGEELVVRKTDLVYGGGSINLLYQLWLTTTNKTLL